MTSERRNLLAISLVFLCAMFACAFGWLRHGPHRGLFQLALFALLLAQSFINYQQISKRRQPDTLTKLFPDSTTERP